VSPAESALQGIYDNLWDLRQVGGWARDDTRFRPRPPSHLYDLVTGTGLSPTGSILDVGCGQGDHACELAHRFGRPVAAIDPVPSNVEAARRRARQEGVDGQVTVQAGVIEDLPYADAAFALVWCRSVVVHLGDLGRPFRECERVLGPGGSFLLQTGFATSLLSEREAEDLCRRLGLVAASLQRPNVEGALTEAGLCAICSESYGSEFAEFYEGDSGRCGDDLLALARLQRMEEAVVERVGRQAYETALGLFSWQVFQMLGKISYHAYLLVKA